VSAPAATTTPGASPTPPTPPGDSPDLRLVIEDDKAAGSYVYMTVNPVTGQVVSQIPREQLLKLREAPDYKPGSVVNTSS
jgi:flagellar protein FlaG